MQTTEVRQHRAVPLLVALATAVSAVGLGFGLPSLAGWLQAGLERSPLPTPGLVEVLAGLPLTWSVPILGGLGVAGGVFLALATAGEALRLTVADDHLEHRTDDREGWVERSDVTDVFRDRRDLVLLGAAGVPRARLDADSLNDAAVQAAFEAHRWPWRDTDPYEGDYVAWMDGRPEFSRAEHTLLRRRLAERKDAPALVEVDTELAVLGLAARTRGDTLQVRRSQGNRAHGAHG